MGVTSSKNPSHALTDDLYESAGDSAAWESCMRAICEHLGGTAIALYTLDLRWCREGCPDVGEARAVRCSVGFDPDFERAYLTHFIRRIPWYAADGPHLEAGHVFLSHAVCPDRALERSEFYADFLRQQQFHYNATAVLERRATELRCLTVQRGPKRRGAFGERTVSRVRRLVPHLRRAARLHEQMLSIGLQQAALLAALDQLPVSMALIDDEGRLVAASPRAMRLLKGENGLSLGKAGRISIAVAGGASRLSRIVKECGPRTWPPVLRVLRPSGGPALSVHVLPVPGAGLCGRSPAALLLFGDPDEVAVPDARTLGAIYGLTPAEERVGVLLTRGFTPRRIAAVQGTSQNTVKTHVKRLFEKVGVNRQADFVRRALTTIPALWASVVTQTGDDGD